MSKNEWEVIIHFVDGEESSYEYKDLESARRSFADNYNHHEEDIESYEIKRIP